MARLSNEFVEKLAIDKKIPHPVIQEQIIRELRLLVEEVAKRHSK